MEPVLKRTKPPIISTDKSTSSWRKNFQNWFSELGVKAEQTNELKSRLIIFPTFYLQPILKY